MANGVENVVGDPEELGFEEVEPSAAEELGLVLGNRATAPGSISDVTGVEVIDDPSVLQAMGVEEVTDADILSQMTSDVQNVRNLISTRSANVGASWEPQKPASMSPELSERTLRMMEDIGAAWSVPGQTLGIALERMGRDEGSFARSFSGLLDFVNSIAGTLVAPVATGLAYTRQLPVIGDVQSIIEKPIGFAGEVVGSHFAAGGYTIAKQLGASDKHAKELSESLSRTGNLLTQIVLTKKAMDVASGVPSAVQKAGRAMSSAATRVMSSAAQAGENLAEAKSIAQTAIRRKITINEAGLTKAEQIAKRLHEELWDKVITPATEAGVGLSGLRLRHIINEFRKEASDVLIKEPKIKNAINKIEKGLDETLAESPDGVTLTPAQAQRYKEKLNAELSSLYQRKAKQGSLAKPAETKLALKEQLNKELRNMLEELHPELHGVNLEIGNILKLIPEMRRYVLERYQGAHSPKFKGTTGMRDFSGKLFIYTQLIGTRSFRSKIAILLDKLGRMLSGDIVKLAEISNPYTWHGRLPGGGPTSSPTIPPIPPTTPALPPSPSSAIAPSATAQPATTQVKVGGTPVTPPPPAPDIVDAKFTDVLPEQLQHPIANRGNLLQGPVNKNEIVKQYRQTQSKSPNEMILEIEAKLAEALMKQDEIIASIAERTGLPHDEILRIAGRYYDALNGVPSRIDGVYRTAKEIIDQYPFAEEAAKTIIVMHDLTNKLRPQIEWIRVAQDISVKNKIPFEKALDIIAEAKESVDAGGFGGSMYDAIEAIVKRVKSEQK